MFSKQDQAGRKRKKPASNAKAVYERVIERATDPEGFLACEFCGEPMLESQMAMHHVNYGGTHGRKTESEWDIAAIHAEGSKQNCHRVIHNQGIKDWSHYARQPL